MNPILNNQCKHLANSDVFLDRKQLALKYFHTEKTLANWATRGYGPPCERVGKKPLYRLCCVKDWENRTFGFPGEDGTPGRTPAGKVPQ